MDGHELLGVTPLSAGPATPGRAGEDLVTFVERVRREAEAAGSHFMDDAEVTVWVEQLRAEDDAVERALQQAPAGSKGKDGQGCSSTSTA